VLSTISQLRPLETKEIAAKILEIRFLQAS